MRSHYLGLRKVFDRWRFPSDSSASRADVERHYAQLSERLGYTVLPPENTVNNLGYVALQSGRVEEALRLFELNVRNHPDSANVYDSLGEALAAAGRLEEARGRYAKAVRRGEATKDPLLDAFRQNLAAITKKLKSSQ
jgi:uncharacterized protein